MSANQRQLLLNSRYRTGFIIYGLLSILVVFLFLGWEWLIDGWVQTAGMETTSVQHLRGFPMAVKIILLLLWGVFSFCIAYNFLDSKFLGVFYRMNHCFQAMSQDDAVTLHFRDGDAFAYMGESFNNMKNMFLDRIRHRKDLIVSLREKIHQLPPDAPEDQVQAIIREIDKELSH